MVFAEYIYHFTGLPVVLPHQEGSDLTVTVEEEQELVDDVEQLRNV